MIYEIQLPSGGTVPVDIQKKRGVRRINLRIDMNSGQLDVSAPYLASQRAIFGFINEKSDWIEKNFEKFKGRELNRPILNFVDGEILMLQGQKYTLRVVKSRLKRAKVELRATEIAVHIWEEAKENTLRSKIKEALHKFYKNIASQVINSRLENFNEYYRFRYKKVTIKSMKTRWGSCSASGNLNFNWRLVMAPIRVLDYVVVHELCHLNQLNHSKKYWELVSEQIKDHKQQRKWLREHGYLLTIE